MSSPDLRPFVVRATALVDPSPPTDVRETRTWLVEPFLEALGWDPRADACATDRTVDDARLEYVATINSVPALFVAVEAYGDSLVKSRASALRRAMAWTGVDRAIYTNGREYLLLAGTTDLEYHTLGLSELADTESVIAAYSRADCARRLEGHSREHVARRLAVERSQLVESIVERLTAATDRGERYADEFETATDRFLDRLVVAFETDETARPETEADVSIRFNESTITEGGEPTTDGEDGDAGSPGGTVGTDKSGAPRRADGTNAGGDTDPPRDADGSNSTEPRGESDTGVRDGGRGGGGDADSEGRGEGSGDDDADERGEYVVRFFNDRGSIGAIGHSTSRGALVEATEYLLERGLAGVDVPWSPDDATETVLNAAPERADGSPMADAHRLSNGLYLATAGGDDDRAARIEALTARAGLRAMVTGDWTDEDGD